MLSALFSACLCLAGPTAQDAQPEVDVSVQALTETAFLLNAGAANVGVFLGSDGVLVVDGGFLLQGPALEATIARLYFDWRERTQGVAVPESGTEAVPIRWQVTTHWHADHAGANPYFGFMGATIVAHESVRGRLAGDAGLGDKVFDPPMDPAGLPAVVVGESLTLHFNGEEVELLHVPNAHTDGDLVVWLSESKVLFTGDVYYSEGFPYIELLAGGRPKGMIRGVDRLLAMLPADATVAPGHGAATGPERMRAYREMLADCDAQMRAAVLADKNLRTLENLKMFGEWEDDWTGGVPGRTKAFMRVMYFCYAPTEIGGVDEFAAEKARGEAVEPDAPGAREGGER